MQVNRFSYYWLDTWVLANIAEGNSRHSTSKETEMRLSVPPGQVWRNWPIQTCENVKLRMPLRHYFTFFTKTFAV